MYRISFSPTDAFQREVITRVPPWWDSIDGTVGDGPRVPIIDQPVATADVSAGEGAMRSRLRRGASHVDSSDAEPGSLS